MNTLPTPANVSLSDLSSKGYLITKRILSTRNEFNLFYKIFDKLLSNISQNHELCNKLEKLTSIWSADKAATTQYMDVHQGLRDRTIRKDRERKIYFQFSRGFIDFLSASSLSKDGDFFDFLASARTLLTDAELALSPAVDLIFGNSPDLKKILFDESNHLSIVYRVSKFMGSGDFAAFPHVDKSLLTGILNSSDADESRFVLCPWHTGAITSSELASPPDRHVHAHGKTVGIILPGVILKNIGFDIQPTPHAVRPVKVGECRFSSVALLVMPKSDPSRLSSRVEGWSKYPEVVL
jgi:hypothetical protein